MNLNMHRLQEDILLTHSAPSVLRVDPYDTDNKNTYLEPGELVVWRWLGLNRFFPPDQQDVRQTVLRGIASVRQILPVFADRTELQGRTI